MKRRILYSDRRSVEGGSHICTVDLISELSRVPDDFDVFYDGTDGTRTLKKVRSILPEKNIRSVPPAKRDKIGFWRVMSEIAGNCMHLKRNKIDLVQCSDQSILCWIIPSFIMRVALVWHAHEIIPSTVRGILRQHVYTVFAKKIICVGPAVKRQIEANWLVFKRDTVVVMNFWPDELPQLPPKSNNKKIKKIGFVGRLGDPAKGLDMFCDVALEVSAACKKRHKTVQFEIFGDGSVDDLNTFKRKIRGDFSSNFKFLGFIDNINEIYGGMDILVICSQMEAFPRIIMEAASFGVPCVAKNVGGIPDMIKHSQTGALYASKEEAVKFIMGFLEDEKSRYVAGAASYDYLSKLTDKGVNLEAYKSAICGRYNGQI